MSAGFIQSRLDESEFLATGFMIRISTVDWEMPPILMWILVFPIILVRSLLILQ